MNDPRLPPRHSDTIRLTVRRQGATADGPQAFEIRVEEPVTLQEALESVYKHCDETVAFRHFTCRRGICGSCMALLDGRVVMACEELLFPGREYSVAAPPGKEVIRDLVFKTRPG
ncbi:MAG: 2Fe-2S iron-sulfur cluster-binding protein [Bacillota bacterium]